MGGVAQPHHLKTTPQAQFVVSPGMGRCLEKTDDRHLRSTKIRSKGQLHTQSENLPVIVVGNKIVFGGRPTWVRQCDPFLIYVIILESPVPMKPEAPKF